MHAPSILSRPFLLVAAATFSVFASFGMLIYALPLYAADELGASDLAVGIAMGAASAGAILVGPPSGRVADRRGRLVVVVGSAALMSVGYAALALEPGLEAVVALRVAAGGAEAALVVAFFTMAVDLAPEGRRGEAMSLVTVGSYSGLAVGPLLAGLLLGDDRFPLVWLVAAGWVVLSGVIGLAVGETRSDEHGDAPAGWLPPRSALVPGAVLLFALLGFGGFNAFVVLHARELGVEHPGLVYFTFGLVVIAVRLFGRRLPDRLGPLVGAAFACGLVAAGLTLAAAWSTPAGLFAGTIVFASGQALAYPSIALLAMARSAPAERSAAVAAVAAFVDVALAAGAFLLGVTADFLDYRAVFLCGALSAALGLVLLAGIRRRRLPAPAQA